MRILTGLYGVSLTGERAFDHRICPLAGGVESDCGWDDSTSDVVRPVAAFRSTGPIIASQTPRIV